MWATYDFVEGIASNIDVSPACCQAATGNIPLLYVQHPSDSLSEHVLKDIPMHFHVLPSVLVLFTVQASHVDQGASQGHVGEVVVLKGEVALGDVGEGEEVLQLVVQIFREVLNGQTSFKLDVQVFKCAVLYEESSLVILESHN